MRVATETGTSPTTTNVIEEETRRILGVALDEAARLLAAHRPELDRLWGALIERESLERADLATLLGIGGGGTPDAAGGIAAS